MRDDTEPRDQATSLVDALLWLSIGAVLGLCLAIWAILPLLKPGMPL